MKVCTFLCKNPNRYNEQYIFAFKIVFAVLLIPTKSTAFDINAEKPWRGLIFEHGLRYNFYTRIRGEKALKTKQ